MRPVPKRGVNTTETIAALSGLTLACGGEEAETESPEPPAPGGIGDRQLASILEYVRAWHGVLALATTVVRAGEVEELSAVGVREEGDPDPVGLDTLIVADAAHAGTDDAMDSLSVLLFERVLASR